MTRKDFQLIADIVATVDDYPTRLDLAYRFANTLADIHPRFDKKKFVQACGCYV